METHKSDIVSFIFGGLFLAFTASVVWDANFGFDIWVWIFPVTILAIGAALLFTGIRTSIKKTDV